MSTPVPPSAPFGAERVKGYSARYASGEWRSRIFADIVLDELSARGRPCTVVDVGCGGGFDGSLELQREISLRAGRFIGVEPDPATAVADCFAEVHRSILEQAPIATASVDVAFAVMVAEHVPQPAEFMAKAADLLVDGGVFLAFTVDARHWSAWASLAFDKLGFKDLYLDRLHGKRGEARYSNFPVHYRLNSPRSAVAHSSRWFETRTLNLFRVGAEDYNLPAALRPINRVLDRGLSSLGAPGSNLVIRAVRKSRG